jgi:hypothetical protein
MTSGRRPSEKLGTHSTSFIEERTGVGYVRARRRFGGKNALEF